MNTVNINIIENGPKNVLLLVYMASDGVTGELFNYPLITLSQLGMLLPGSSTLPPRPRLRLSRIEYNYSGFDAVISFDSGTIPNNYKWVLTEGANAPVDFDAWGRVFDNSGLDGNGNLEISTVGFTSSTDQGSMLIRLVK